MAGQLLTTSQVAGYLNVPKKTIYNLVSQRRIPFLRVGGSLRFSIETINEWLTAGARIHRSKRCG